MQARHKFVTDNALKYVLPPVAVAAILSSGILSPKVTAHKGPAADASIILAATQMPHATAVVESPEKRKPAGPSVKPKSGIMAPLDRMHVTSRFGLRRHPVLDTVRSHDGVDLRAKLNDPVRATSSGKVTFAGRRGGYGNTVEIYHPALKRSTLYAHLNRIKTRKGAHVAAGQVIGLAGTTGLSTGVHLHFAVADSDGDWTNPIPFLNGAEKPESSFVIASNHNEIDRKSVPPTRRARTSNIVASNRDNHRLSAPKQQSVKVAKIGRTKTNIASASGASLNSPTTRAAQKPRLSPTQGEIAVATRTKPAPQDIAALKDRYEAAARQAEVFSKLYDEGAVSRNDRDQRLASASVLASELQKTSD
jgi:hypothetical protein